MNEDPRMTEGVYLTFFALENARHGHRLLHDWMAATALEMGLPGCSVFRSIGGYGHHHRRHSQRFVELQGELPVEIVFALTAEQADALLARVRDEGMDLFFVRMPASFGFTGSGREESGNMPSA